MFIYYYTPLYTIKLHSTYKLSINKYMYLLCDTFITILSLEVILVSLRSSQQDAKLKWWDGQARVATGKDHVDLEDFG